MMRGCNISDFAPPQGLGLSSPCVNAYISQDDQGNVGCKCNPGFFPSYWCRGCCGEDCAWTYAYDEQGHLEYNCMSEGAGCSKCNPNGCPLTGNCPPGSKLKVGFSAGRGSGEFMMYCKCVPDACEPPWLADSGIVREGCGTRGVAHDPNHPNCVKCGYCDYGYEEWTPDLEDKCSKRGVSVEAQPRQPAGSDPGCSQYRYTDLPRCCARCKLPPILPTTNQYYIPQPGAAPAPVPQPQPVQPVNLPLNTVFSVSTAATPTQGTSPKAVIVELREKRNTAIGWLSPRSRAIR